MKVTTTTLGTTVTAYDSGKNLALEFTLPMQSCFVLTPHAKGGGGGGLRQMEKSSKSEMFRDNISSSL